MDDTTPRIIGDRRLPCHGQRAARLSVADGPVTRACALCGARYSISFVEEPHFTGRLGIPVYRPEIAPWVDGRTRRRQEREAAADEASPHLPFGEEWAQPGR